MDWLIENTAEFEKLVREQLKKEVKINWKDGVRLLLIAKEFEIWDKFAVNRISEDVELFSYNLYENNELRIEKVPLPKDFKSKIKKMRITPSREVTVEQHLSKIKNDKMREMATELREAIRNISDDIEEKTSLEYIAFRTTINFALIYSQKRGFWLAVKIPRNEFDVKGFDAKEQWSDWTHIRVNEDTDLNLLIDAAKEAYERTL